MANEKRATINDSTVARMAGNIAASMGDLRKGWDEDWIVQSSVALARALVAEVERTSGETETK